MMMKFNFGSDPLTMRGTSCDGTAHIRIELESPYYEDISTEVITDLAKKLYSTFNVDCVSLYRDDVCICTIDKEEKEGE